MNDHQQAIDELSCYSLAHGDPSFIHQYVVDAFAAQTCNESDKPIKLAFALVGLYLHVEKGRTGKQVQMAHMKLARRKQIWPTIPLPQSRGSITVDDVLAAPEGPERDEMIHHWCASVWEAFSDSRPLVETLLAENQIA